jgi:broad specificity phosphatase PhoE
MYPRFEPKSVPDSSLIEALQREQADGAFFSSLDHDMSVFALRHGQSEGNARNTYQGRLDYPLSAHGEEQARAAGEWLRQFSPDCIIASPMQRARRSAEIVADLVHVDHIEFSDLLIEVDTGIFSGIDADTAARTYPALRDRFYMESWDAIPDAEPSQSMYGRAILAWRRIRELGMGGASRIVCMTHGGLLQWLMKSTLGVHRWLPLLPMSNCGISQYEIEIVKKNSPAFVQWTKINFHPPHAPEGPKPVF